MSAPTPPTLGGFPTRSIPVPGPDSFPDRLLRSALDKACALALLNRAPAIYPEDAIKKYLAAFGGPRPFTRAAILLVHRSLGLGFPSGAHRRQGPGTSGALGSLESRFPQPSAKARFTYELVDVIVARALFMDRKCRDENKKKRNARLRQYLDVAPAELMPCTQLEARLRQPEGHFNRLAAAGDTRLLALQQNESAKFADRLLDIGSACGEIKVLEWTIKLIERKLKAHLATVMEHQRIRYPHEPAAKRERYAKITVEAELPRRVKFTDKAFLGAAGQGHLHVLQWWHAWCTAGRVICGHLFRPRPYWPKGLFERAISSDANTRHDLVLWLLQLDLTTMFTNAPVGAASLPPRDALVIAATKGDVRMAQILWDHVAPNRASEWFRALVRPSILHQAALHGHVEVLEWSLRVGMVDYFLSHPEQFRSQLHFDGNLLARKGRVAELEWLRKTSKGTAAARGCMRLVLKVKSAVTRVCCSAYDQQHDADSHATPASHVLEWLWVNTPRAQFEYSVAALDNCTSLDVLDWWLSKAEENGGLGWLKYSQDAVDNACKLGRLDVVQWWWNAAVGEGLEFLYSRKSVDQACEFGHVELLDWWLERLEEGSMPLLKYSPLSILRAAANDHGHVLEWFERNAIPIRYNPRAKLSASSFTSTQISSSPPTMPMSPKSAASSSSSSSSKSSGKKKRAPSLASTSASVPRPPSPATVARTRIEELLGQGHKSWQDSRLSSDSEFTLTRGQWLHARAQMAAAASAAAASARSSSSSTRGASAAVAYPHIAPKSTTNNNKRRFGATLSANTTPTSSPRSRTLALPETPTTPGGTPLSSPPRTSSKKKKKQKMQE